MCCLIGLHRGLNSVRVHVYVRACSTCRRLTILKIKTVFENVRALVRNLKITTEK